MHNRTMRMTFLLFFLAASAAVGQDTSTDRFAIPLSDPARPAKLRVSLMGGSIHVKAYAGKEVVVETRHIAERDDDERSTRGGLRLIPKTGAGLTIEEEDNRVSVSTGHHGMGGGLTLVIQVPVQTSVDLKTINDGDITVEGISGEIEANNINGPVTLTNVSGSAVAHALNDDLIATFTSVTPGKAMSFSSMNGTIDVTLPSSVNATVDLRSDQGEIYTDFDIAMQKISPKIEREERGNKKRVIVEKGMRGTINGGGAEYLFKNFTGDIVIRKGK